MIAMGDVKICPRILWKVDLSLLNSVSKSLSQSLYILKSYWRIVINKDEDWDEYKIFIRPENPDVFSNVRFFMQCGVRDVFDADRFETSQRMSAVNLLTRCIWGAARSLLIEENIIQNNFLYVFCTVEPESNWDDCKVLADSKKVSGSSTSMPCSDALINDFRKLFESNFHHDVILECENKTIEAHKSVLSCRSTVFEAMFRNETKEALEGRVVINETPFHIFEKIIRYVYTSEIHFIDIDFACKIYEEADKYFITSLKERCRIFFRTYLYTPCVKDKVGSRVTDACRIIYLADQHGDIPLQCWIQDYLADSKLLVTPEWKNFAESNPDFALKIYFKLLKKVTKL